MSMSTRATFALDKVGVNFTLHSYDYDPAAERIGLRILLFLISNPILVGPRYPCAHEVF
jgi:Cys-tRNA(Pro)/Cys-tRNA(Cys) deacylase